MIEEFHDWYRYRRLLKYTLFEYENWLLLNEGKGAKPKLKWNIILISIEKKGNSGVGHCYSNSDIRQEKKISEYAHWTVETCKSRRMELVNWIIQIWGIDN